MHAPVAAPTAVRSRWWNPLFLFVFASATGAWGTVVGWLVWRYANSVHNWIDQQHELFQEILTPFFIAVVLGLLIGGVLVAMGIADRAAGIPPSVPAPGKKSGQHARWTPPKRG